MKIISKEFNHGGFIPRKFTCNGEGISPELEFLDVPENVKSLVLIVDDQDVPEVFREDRNFDHWILFNIPPETKKILENSMVGISGKNTKNELNYVRFCPPDTIHRYFFRLYALDGMLDLKEGVSKYELYKSMEKKILEKAVLVGLYEQPENKKTIELK